MSETRILEGEAACGELALDLSIYLEDAFLEEKEKKDSRILNPGAAEGPLLSQKAVVKASQQIRPRVPTRREGKTAPLPAGRWSRRSGASVFTGSGAILLRGVRKVLPAGQERPWRQDRPSQPRSLRCESPALVDTVHFRFLFFLERLLETQLSLVLFPKINGLWYCGILAPESLSILS